MEIFLFFLIVWETVQLGCFESITHDERLQRLVEQKVKDKEYTLARNVFSTIPKGEEAVEKFVIDFYGGNQENLEKVIKFASGLDEYKNKTYTVLFLEMKKNNHTLKNELLLMYYSIPDFKAFNPLRVDLEPWKNQIMEGFKYNIFNYTYNKVDPVYQLLNIEMLELFLVDLAELLISEEDYKTKFPTIISYSQQLPLYENSCAFLKAIAHQLESRGEITSLEALEVWIKTQYYFLLDENQGDQTYFQKCKAVNSELTPTKVSYMEIYKKKLKAKEYKDLHKMHKLYPDDMEYFLDLIIKAMDNSTFTSLYPNFIKFMKDSYIIAKSCVFAKAMAEQLKINNMILKHEAFLILLHSKCLEVREKIPTVFQILLENISKDFRLLNAQYNEPFYCPSSSYESLGLRYSITWHEDRVYEDQKLKFRIVDDKLRIDNNYCIRRLKYYPKSNNVFWAEKDVKRYDDLWIIEAYDMTSSFLSFQVHNVTLYMGSIFKELGEKNRPMKLLPEKFWKAVWRLQTEGMF